MTSAVSLCLRVIGNIVRGTNDVKVNKQQCATLKNRLLAMQTSLQQMPESRAASKAGRQALQRLLDVCKRAQSFVFAFSHKNWLKQLLNHSRRKESLANINRELSDAAHDLELTMVMSLFDAQVDANDEFQDQCHIKQALESLQEHHDEAMISLEDNRQLLLQVLDRIQSTRQMRLPFSGEDGLKQREESIRHSSTHEVKKQT